MENKIARQIRTSNMVIYSDYEYSLQNQKYFETSEEKKSFIDSLTKIYNSKELSYIRVEDRVGNVQLDIPYEKALEGKYIKFKNMNENKDYYAQVTLVEYISSKIGDKGKDVSKIFFTTDWINTLDLNVGQTINVNTVNSVIEREHVMRIENAKGICSYVDTGTDLTVNHKSLIFDDYYVCIQSTVSLTGEYGDADAPKVTAARGQTFDKLPSAQTSYIINLKKFSGLLRELKDYPWIVKNFTNITLLPIDMISDSELEEEKAHKNLYMLKDGGESTNLKFKDISFTTEELRENFGLATDGSEDDLLRYPHSYIEIVDYSGGYMLVDPSFLPKSGMTVNGITTLGSLNQLEIYIEEYKNKWHDGDLLNGEFLGTSLTLSNFPILPVQIDNYQLALASNANSRKVANEAIYFGAATGAISAIGQGMTGNLMGAATGAVGTASNLYFQTQQQLAAYEDKRITPVSLTSQSTNYGNLIANRMFGIHVRFKQNQENALKRVKGDFCWFGFPTKRIGRVETPNKMTVVDFIKTSTINFNGKYVPKMAIEPLEELFTAGVHFWHKETTTDIFKNVRRTEG